VQVLAVFVLPDFFGVIAVVEENGRGVPVELFLRHERPALKDENFLAGLREVQRERPPPAPVPMMIASYSAGMTSKMQIDSSRHISLTQRAQCGDDEVDNGR
jgi:hypothetical protein